MSFEDHTNFFLNQPLTNIDEQLFQMLGKLYVKKIKLNIYVNSKIVYITSFLPHTFSLRYLFGDRASCELLILSSFFYKFTMYSHMKRICEYI